MHLSSAVIASLMLFCGCSHKQSQPASLLPSPSLLNPSIHFEFAVYMLPTSAKDASTVLRNDLLQKYPGLTLVDKIPEKPTAPVISAHMQTNVAKTYAPPDSEAVDKFGKGLTEAQSRALQKSKEAFILDFACSGPQVWTTLHAANLLVEDVARETQGLIWDDETRQIFSADGWHDTRIAKWDEGVPPIHTQTVVQAYQNGEFVRAISLGMGKAGLPDVVVENFVWTQQKQVANLINLFTQSMAEGAAFEIPGSYTLKLQALRTEEVRKPIVESLRSGSTGVAYLTLERGASEEGDPHNRLIVLTPKIYPGTDYHAKLDGMLSCFFGGTDAATGVKHDEVILEASRKARENLPALKKAFNAGLAPAESILLKAPFKRTTGGNEWMWVEVSRWNEGEIAGVLSNDPFDVPDLHAGQTVTFRQDEVFDYIHNYPDGRSEGNSTGEILEKMPHKDIPQSYASTLKPLFSCGPFR